DRRHPQGNGREAGGVRSPLLPEAGPGGHAEGDRGADERLRPGRACRRLRAPLAGRDARLLRGRGALAVPVTKVIEVIGSSSEGADAAVREAVAAASRSIRGISHVDVLSVNCDVEKDQIVRWNALVKIAF